MTFMDETYSTKFLGLILVAVSLLGLSVVNLTDDECFSHSHKQGLCCTCREDGLEHTI